MGVSDAFFRSCQLSDVTLRVKNLELLATWYREVLGGAPAERTAERAVFAVEGAARPLLVLEAAPRAFERPPHTAGLFHFAVLYPSRGALGRVARALVEKSLPFGTGDHGVSEALYLEDPEGNGVELYADRPAAAWPPSPDGEVAMYTREVDLRAVLAAGAAEPGPLLPAGTRIGHIHLCVSELAKAEAFYGDVLGFPIRQRSFPGALFLGRDGYHHHFGANIWRSRLPAKPGAAGLRCFVVSFAGPAELARVLERARERGFLPEETPEGARLSDADGLACLLRTEEGA